VGEDRGLSGIESGSSGKEYAVESASGGSHCTAENGEERGERRETRESAEAKVGALLQNRDTRTEEESSRVEENSGSAAFEGRLCGGQKKPGLLENEKNEKKGRRSQKETCREKRVRERPESQVRLLWKKNEAGQPIGYEGFRDVGR
jgi:hypothetical protein